MLTGSGRDWPGAYFDGRTAGRTDVTVRLTDEGIRISGLPAGDAFWYHFEIRLAPATAPGDPVRVERVTVGDSVVIADAAARAALLPALVPGAGAGRWSLRRQLLSLLGATLAFVVALYLWVIPWAASRAAARVPVEWEERLGETMLTSLTRSGRTCQEPERLAALEKMLATLTADGRGDRYTYRITVVDDSLVNALAAPGGQVVFFRGLIEAAESPEELAGVLAHEVQHIVLRHGTTGILRQIPIQLLVGAVTGGGLGEQALGAAATLGNLGYARDDELAADRAGMRMLQAAQVGTAGMVSFMGRLAELNDAESDPGLMTYLSTHPASADRAARLSALASESAYTPRPLLTAAEWSAVRAPCERPAASRSTDGSAGRR